MTLVEFLRARLNEDQHTARIASACSADGQYDAQTWCVAEGIMRQHARDVGSLAGIRMSHQMADAILGEDDGRPLP